MSALPPAISAAYERGRARAAAQAAAPLLLLPLALALAGLLSPPQALLSLGMIALFGLFSWRGQAWARGASVGLGAGLALSALPLLLLAGGLACAGPGCPPWCASVCVAGSVLAGGLLGWKAANEGSGAWLAGVTMAGLAAALGCLPLGGAVLAGELAALAGTAAVGWGVRRARI